MPCPYGQATAYPQCIRAYMRSTYLAQVKDEERLESLWRGQQLSSAIKRYYQRIGPHWFRVSSRSDWISWISSGHVLLIYESIAQMSLSLRVSAKPGMLLM